MLTTKLMVKMLTQFSRQARNGSVSGHFELVEKIVRLIAVDN